MICEGGFAFVFCTPQAQGNGTLRTVIPAYAPQDSKTGGCCLHQELRKARELTGASAIISPPEISPAVNALVKQSALSPWPREPLRSEIETRKC